MKFKEGICMINENGHIIIKGNYHLMAISTTNQHKKLFSEGVVIEKLCDDSWSVIATVEAGEDGIPNVIETCGRLFTEDQNWDDLQIIIKLAKAIVAALNKDKEEKC